MSKKQQTVVAEDAKPNEEKLKALLSKYRHPDNLTWFRTGIHPLDLLLGDGLPLGRIIEVFGGELAGKSLLAWLIIREVQRKGGIAVFCDKEGTTPTKFIQDLGVNTDELIYYTPETVEEVGEDFDRTIGELRAVTNVPIFWVIDSIAALSSRSEWEGEGDAMIPKETQQPARLAAAMSQFFKWHVGKCSKQNVTMICLNQLREKIGVMFGKKTESPGGRALKHYASIRLEINRGTKYKISEEIHGVAAHFNVVKTKLTPPFRKAELRIDWGTGYNKFVGLDQILLEAKRIKIKAAGKLEYGDEVFAKADIQQLVERHPELLQAWV